MATETLAPEALLDQTNLTGTVADIDDDPDSPDGNWLTEVDDGDDSICRVSFPSPSGNLTTGAGLQEFRAWIRRSQTAGGNDPTVDLELYEAGTLVTQISLGTTVTSTTGVILAGTWDASALAAVSGVDVECRIVGHRSGGAPGSRRTIEVGAVEWNVDYTTGATASGLIGVIGAIA